MEHGSAKRLSKGVRYGTMWGMDQHVSLLLPQTLTKMLASVK